MTCYEAFRNAHRQITDSAQRAERAGTDSAAEQHRLLTRRIHTALHLAWSQEEIDEAAGQFLNSKPHKL